MRQQDFQSNSILSKGCGCLSLSLFSLIFFGIILEIVLPSFLVITKKAKQSEAKQYVSSMNKGQQAYYAERSAFSNYIPDLGLGIKTETTNYKYSTRVTKTAAFSYAEAKENTIKNYFGGVFLVPAKVRTVSILCETEDRPLFRFKPPVQPAEPTYQNGEVICGKGTTAVTK